MRKGMKMNNTAKEIVQVFKDGMNAVYKRIEEKAIKYDDAALFAFAQWQKNGENENDLYWNMWHENNERCYAMLNLLDECETEFLHYVVNGKIVREFVI